MASKKKQTELGIHVIYGEDAFLVSKACENLLDTLLANEDRSMALYEPKADQADISDVLDELRTVPFLTSKRVVLIKDAESFVRANSAALALADQDMSGDWLILTLTSWDKRTRLHKKLQKTDALMQVGKLYSNQLPGYAAAYAQKTYGIRLDGNTSRLLVELVGDETGRLCREIDKLVMYVSPRKKISFEDVESLIGHNRMFDAFGVIDAITAGQIGAAISRIRKMFEADKTTEYTVIGAFGYHFRRLFQVKGLISKGLSPQQAAGKMGIRYKQSEFLRQVSRLSLQQFSWTLAELGRIDFGLKTGKTSAPIAMERFILKVFSMQKSASVQP